MLYISYNSTYSIRLIFKKEKNPYDMGSNSKKLN